MADTTTFDVSLDPDPVVQFYKKSVDREAIRENLKKSYEERIRSLQQRLMAEAQRVDSGALKDEQEASIQPS
ncbi:MAG: hypothetical protein JOZ54_13035 [Acidobacteria bacterium]|nr:hypothetical protein [Acidobacteriota bacterium]